MGMRKSSKKVFISQHPSASARKGRGAGGTTCSWGRTWVTGSPHLGTAPTSAQPPPRHSPSLSTGQPLRHTTRHLSTHSTGSQPPSGGTATEGSAPSCPISLRAVGPTPHLIRRRCTNSTMTPRSRSAPRAFRGAAPTPEAHCSLPVECRASLGSPHVQHVGGGSQEEPCASGSQ